VFLVYCTIKKLLVRSKVRAGNVTPSPSKIFLGKLGQNFGQFGQFG